MAFRLLSQGMLRRELTRLLYNWGCISCLDENLVDLKEFEDGALLLSFGCQDVYISREQRELCLDDVSLHIVNAFVPISDFQSALARSVSAMHSV